VLVVRYIKRAVGAERETRRAVRGLTRLFDRAGEAVRENDKRPRRLAVGQRLEDDVVAALRERRAVPRAVESDECAAAIGLRELLRVVKQRSFGAQWPGKAAIGARLSAQSPTVFPSPPYSGASTSFPWY
jgi:hypothetical protein